MGLPRRKGVKSYGPVNNVLCHSSTDFYLGGVLSAYDENTNDVISILLKRYVNVEDFTLIDMNNGFINGDRGYEIEGTKINAQHLNTTKRKSTLPFSFGTCQSQNKDQFVIPESGSQTTYRATIVQNQIGKKLIAYRSGTGSVGAFNNYKKRSISN